MPPSEKGPRRRPDLPANERAPEDDLGGGATDRLDGATDDLEVGAPDEVGAGATDELSLRVSVGTLARVLFRGPENERTMLALERTATLREVGGRSEVVVVAKPFGGGIRIVDPAALRDAIGTFRYDSDRSRRERDFRLQIRPVSWEAVKGLCRAHFSKEAGGILDTSPDRELAEEFGDALGMSIEPSQYRLRPAGMLVEDTPTPTHSWRAPGRPTVRVYYVFEAWLEAPELVASILESSRTSDADLRAEALRQAERGGRGRANAALALGLDELRSTYLTLPRAQRDGGVTVRGHRLAGNVTAILDRVDAPG